jgi:hypothetical protein
MNPTGIEQPCNPVFQPGHHENSSDLDAGDWAPSDNASMSGRFPGSGQKTLYRSGREQPAVYCALSFRLTIPVLAGPGIPVTDGFQLKSQLHPGGQVSCR